MLALYELMDLLPSTLESQLRPRLKELLEFLKKSERMDEATAAVQFLGSNKKHFNKLKNELKDELCNYVLIHPSKWADSEQKRIKEFCYKNFAAYKLLLTSGRRVVAIERAKTLFPKLCQLEIHGLIYIVAQDLEYHYSGIDIVPRLAKKYSRIVEQQAEYIQAEAIIRKCHSRISFVCNTRSNFPPAIIDELESLINKCKPFLALKSKTLNRLIFNMVIARYAVAYDYEQVLHYCNVALSSFSPSYPNYNSLRFDFLQSQIPALIATGELNDAKNIAKEIGQMMPAGKFNWHVALIRRIIICLHIGDYQEAYDLFKAHTKQRSSYQVLTEYWKIIEGFIYFLIQVGQIEKYTEERFLLGKFLNEVPLYSKDKAGNNINILLLQIIIRMHRGEYGKIIDRIDCLREYVRNHTRNPETKRANIFINMILKMESASFHKNGTERKTMRLLKRLNSTPLILGQNLSIEIIPYPVLWQEMMNLLENKFRAQKLSKVSNRL